MLLRLAVEKVVVLSGIANTSRSNSRNSGGNNTVSSFDTTARDAMLATVKDIWFAYLESWQNAAEVYGRLYPEVRFSFRDAFLSTVQRGVVQRYLSAKVTQEIWRGKKGKRDDEREQKACND